MPNPASTSTRSNASSPTKKPVLLKGTASAVPQTLHLPYGFSRWGTPSSLSPNHSTEKLIP
jgi:hypothetical protein